MMQWTLQLLVVVFLLQLLKAQKASAVHTFIYVDSNSHVNDSSCWGGKRDKPCSSLALGLEGVRNLSAQENPVHPWLYLQNGNYTLEISTLFAGPEIEDFGIVGNASNVNVSEDSSPSVVINCNKNAGFKFTNVTEVTFQAVWLKGCGAISDTTSLQNRSASPPTFWQFRAGLYFLFCQDLTFTGVWVTESTGISVLIYSTVGNNTFQYCNISGSEVPSGDAEKYPAAGGVYIEFTYCNPGSCTLEKESTVITPIKYASGSNYSFVNCSFNYNQGDIPIPLAMEETFILPQGPYHNSLGRGGGMSIIFKGQSHDNVVLIDDCKFQKNKALWGGGLFVEYQDNSTSSKLTVHSSYFSENSVLHGLMETDNNTVKTGGGGTRVGYVFFGYSHVRNNQITFDGCKFLKNLAYWGGGVSFYAAREQDVTSATNSLKFIGCSWLFNLAQLGAAVDLSVWHPVTTGSTVEVVFSGHNLFTVNNWRNLTRGVPISLGVVYIDSIPTRFYDRVDFTSNNHTAIATVDASIDFDNNCSANFLNNYGRNGGAIALYGYSFIRAGDYANFTFINNSAELTGGAIYSTTTGNRNLISSRNCFVRFHKLTSTPSDWTASYYFEKNVAGGRPNSIHTTSILPCMWGGAYGPANSIDPSSAVFCNSLWTYAGGNCSTEIETDPAHFTVTNKSDITFTVHPGMPKLLPNATWVRDDFGKNVSDRVVFTASSYNLKNLTVDNDSRPVYVSDNRITLFGNPNTTDVQIELYTIGSRVLYTNIVAKLLECPTGFVSKESTCVCASEVQFRGRVRCYNSTFTSSLVYHGQWVGLVNNTNGSKELMAGNVHYTLHDIVKSLQLDPNSSEVGESLCKPFNRKGVLCGECIEGFSPAINSVYRCVNCTAVHGKYSWALYILTEMLPPTILFLIILLFNISLTSGPVNGFIFFSQVLFPIFDLYFPDYRSVPRSIFVAIYDIWNLNFFDSVSFFEYCIHPSMNTIDLIALEYLVAIYPLILVIFLYVLVTLYNRSVAPIVWLFRPLHHCIARIRGPWNLQRSVTDTIAAFLLLSYVKFTTTSYFILEYSTLFSQDDTAVRKVVYFQGTMEWFKGEHIAYAILAIVIMTLFVLIPTLLIFLFPLKIFHSCIRFVTRGRYHISGGKIELFLNTFYGCYKDGTQKGEWDLRFVAGLYFAFRLALAAITFNQQWAGLYLQQNIFLILAGLLFATLRPYRNDFFNSVDTVMFTLLALISILNQYNFNLQRNEGNSSTLAYVLQYILMACPLIYLIVFLLHMLWVTYIRPHYLRWKGKDTTDDFVSTLGISVSMARDIDDDNSVMRLIDERPTMYKRYDNTPITYRGDFAKDAGSKRTSDSNSNENTPLVASTDGGDSSEHTNGSERSEQNTNSRSYGSTVLSDASERTKSVRFAD